jgi:hypothetical protein
MSVYDYSVCVVQCVCRGLEKGLSPVKEVLPSVYRLMKVKKQPSSNKRAEEPIIIHTIQKTYKRSFNFKRFLTTF